MKRLLAALAALLILPACAHAQSAALIPPAGVTSGECGTFTDIYGTISSSGVACSGGNVTVNDAAAGSAVLTPNAFGLSAAALLNNKSQKPIFFTRSVPTTGMDAGDYTCYRDANYAGTAGQPHGFVNPCLYSYTIARAGTGAGTPSGAGFEWSFLARLDNYSNLSDVTENTAAYIQARKLGTAPTFGIVPEVIDFAANPVAGTITDEHDMSVSGTDNNNARVIIDMWARNIDALWYGSPVTSEVAWGIRFNTDAYTTLKHGIYFNTGLYGDGINLALGSFSSGGAIVLADGQKICTTAFCANYLMHSGGATYVGSGGGNLVSFSDAGQVTGTVLNTSGGDVLFGGSTSAYPMLRRNGAGVDVKLADNSALSDLTAFNLGAVNVNAINNVGVGAKMCLDGATCTYYLDKSGSNLRISTPSGVAAAFTGLSSNLLATTATSVDSGGRISVAGGQKFCLDGTTCANYLTQSGGSVALWAGGSNSATFGSVTNNLAAVTALSVTAPSLTASNTAGTFRSVQYQTAGSQRWVTYADSTAESGANAGTDFGINRYSDTAVYLGTPLTIKRSTGDVTLANNLVVTGNGTAANIIVPTGGKVCFDGATCSTYLKYDGSFNVQMWSSGVAFASFNIFNQTFGTSNGFTVGANTGVTCAAGISAATFRSVLGIVTHC